ncbi:dihydroneopterin aldolase [Eubacterium sp.]|uniref:dihydroneopterin aldolase n=1 Tax=Eubacterium sp. TaxID=142586 RepID=UPI0025F8468C|nr:dihydroneopterin aldolase [uncultured Eubacterium sp.]MDD5837506.1 dihydroneopterin aldolase [Eubacteriales bacterium]
MDKISIKGLRLFAYHGVNPEEKENGQTFVIDMDYYVNIARACQMDSIDDTVSYARVVKAIRNAFCENKYDLIEKAAQVVADAVLEEFPDIFKVDITLKKPEAPIKADFDYVAVTISRER